MKRIVVSAALLASAVGAQAADLPAKAPFYKAPVAAQVYDWTGFYFGANAGVGLGRSLSQLIVPDGAIAIAERSRFGAAGAVGGGQIGYNWQIQRAVVGFEADIQGTDEKGSRSFTCATGICTPPVGGILALVIPGPAVPVTLNQKIDWFGTVRGRLGYLVDPRVLIYATGGLAYGEVDSSATIGLVPTGFGAVSSTHVGWTAGAGIEGMIGGNWTARLEYLFVDLGTVNGSFQTAIGGLGGGVLSSNYSSHVHDNVLRVGVNYKFGGGPVVAKY
jgi:outer membrane immunogenic protein